MTGLPPELLAKQKIQEAMRRHGRSVFGADGNLRADAAAEMSNGNVLLGEYLDLSIVPFAEDPYGSDHCIALGKLASYMMELPERMGGFPDGTFQKHDYRVIHAVAMLYCTGRHKQYGDLEGYAARSAKIADAYFQDYGGGATYWSKAEVREEICRLIYKHNDPAEIKIDKRLQVLSDALTFELARLAPNTVEGLRILKEHVKPDRFFLGFSKNEDNFRTWMKYRGWK